MSSSIQQQYQILSKRVEEAAKRSDRKPSEISILAVSKTHSSDRILEALDSGLYRFGENYLQEAIPKIKMVSKMRPESEWHFIGRIQSRKVSAICEHFSWIHSLDRLKIAKIIDQDSKALGKKMNVFIQVNESKEESKGGVAPSELKSFFSEISAYTHLNIRGLMTFPPYQENPQKNRVYFQALREHMIDLNQEFNLSMDQLSMGVSHDFEVAIEEGATMVRLGSLIFGERETAAKG